MAGRSASTSVTRYAGIQVQTSSMGLQIPVGWGTFRCKCNLVDYLDFNSKAQKAASGKGGSTTTGYSYSATIILAICEGPIDAVTSVYVDSKVYVNGSTNGSVNTGGGSACSQAGLSLSSGAIGQPVWSYLTSSHPDRAIGYSGLAIAYAENYALDSGASTPNHAFEVVRLAGFNVAAAPANTPDADPSLVVMDFFTNTRTGVPGWNGPANSQAFGAALVSSPALAQYRAYCLAAGLLVSPVIDSQRSASDFLTELLLATNATCVWSEGTLKLIPYGDTALTGNGVTYAPNNTAVYSLGDDDFIVKSSGDPPLTVEIADQSDAYNVVQLEYLDRTNQYNMAIALANDAANVAQYGERRQDPTTVHCLCTPAVAQQAAQLHLQRTLFVRGQYRFALHYSFMLLEPGDIVEITDPGLGLSAYPVRIIQIDEDEDGNYDITAEDLLGGVATAPLYVMQTGQGTSVNRAVDPGGVEANLLSWSQDFSNAVWTASNLTVTPAAATDPVYGASDACAVIPTLVNGYHALSQGLAAFEGLNYVFSLYLKPNGRKVACLKLSDSAGTDGVLMTVDLSAGAVLSDPTAIGSGSGAAGGLVDAGSGWWRAWVLCSVPTAPALVAELFVCDDSGALVWTGDGTNGLYAFGAQLKQGVDLAPYAYTDAQIAGPYLFNPPSVLTSGQQGEVWAAVAGGANWGGCYVWTSFDGSSYAQVGLIESGARYGRIANAVAAVADPDTSSIIEVDLAAGDGALTGGTEADAASSATLSLIDSELVAYSTATLTGPGQYALSAYTRRGVMGTTIASHPAGAPFVRLDEAIFAMPYHPTVQGNPVYVKFQSFNPWGEALQSLADCNPYTVTPNPDQAGAPGAAAWVATGVSVTEGAVSAPALQILGACDNPAATAVLFYFRPTGAAAWISAGAHPADTTGYDIVSVAAGGAYDVAVAYLVHGVIGQQLTISTAIVAGAQVAAAIVGQAPSATDFTIQGGATYNQTFVQSTDPNAGASLADGAFWFDTASGVFYHLFGGGWVAIAGQIADGVTLFSTGQAAASGTFTVPANALGYVTLTVQGAPGGAGYTAGADHAGGGGGICAYHFAVSPGSTTIDWSTGARGLAAASANGGGGGDSTASSTAFSGTLTGVGGQGGTATAVGSGGSAAGPSGSVLTTGPSGAEQGPLITIVTHAS